MSRYDSRTTTFSPEGRLFQVEYALEAINNAAATIGVQTKEGVILAADKAQASKLLDQGDEREKIYVIDKQVVCAVAGWTADANVLVNHARLLAQRYLFRYDEPMPLETLVLQLCDVKQSYTQFGGLRPFGVSFLIAGWDEHKGFQLFHTDPAGNFAGWRTTAIGQNSQSAQSILKEKWTEAMTLDEGLTLASRIFVQLSDTAPTPDSLEFCILSNVDGHVQHRMLDPSEIKRLLTEASQHRSEDQAAEMS